MNGFAHSLEHSDFFQALADCEEGTPTWTTVSAGLVVLRLVDAWIEEGTNVVNADSWSLRAARESVLAMPAGDPSRELLTGVLDTLETQRAMHPSKVFPRLMAYGQALDYDGHYQLAADVFRTVAAHVRPLEDPDLAIDANMQLAYATRMLGDYNAAEMAAAQAREIAINSADHAKVLRTRMVDAKIALVRGNLPRAESILVATIAEAEQAQLPGLKGVLLQDRAQLEFLRGDLEQGILFSYEGLSLLDSQAARERTLADIAAAFLELGAHDTARDALRLLAATGQEQFVRWQAQLNLLDLSARTQSETLFEQYRRGLQDAELPPSLRAHYHYEVGVGYQRFQRFAQAEGALEIAMRVSSEEQMHQLYFQAEQAIAAVRQQVRLERARSVEPAPAIRNVARAITAMRVEAGVPG